MEDQLLKKLKAGIEQEIESYESMLKISHDEQEVLKREAYSRELINLASEKLRLLNHINQIGLMLGPLKVMWIREREGSPETSTENEIDPLINRLSEVLEELVMVDKANTEKLAEMTGAVPEDEPLPVADHVAATEAYKNLTLK